MLQAIRNSPIPEQSRTQAFRGERLQLVREFNGYTQKQLASLLGTSTAAVSDLENGKRIPNGSIVERLVFETGFTEDFYFRKVDDPFLEVECSFRHRRSTSQRQKDQVRAHASLLGLVAVQLRARFRLPVVSVPHFYAASLQEVETAAAACRTRWGLDSNAPIRQVVRVLENAGVIVISGSVEVGKIDAFSRNGENPMVFLNRAVGTNPSRWHFDLAHELGHLVLHWEIATGSAESEAQADQFASAFLMPAGSFASDFRARPFSWSLVFELKRRWQTSAAAIIRRARDLELLSEVAYRRAFQYMSARKWRSLGEPYEPFFQEPELFTGTLSALKHHHSGDLTSFAHELGMSSSVFSRITGTEVNTAKKASLIIFPASD